MTRRSQLGCALAAALVAASCSEIAGLGDFEDAQSTTSGGGHSSSSGDGGTTNGGGGTTTSSGGAGGTGGAGGGGGQPPKLVDRGLVARYYLDEAASGTDPNLSAQDAAPSPFDLPLIYGGMSYAADQGNRGLEWVTADTIGKAGVGALVNNAKLISQLNHRTTATLEVVVRIDGTGSDNSFFWDMRDGNWPRVAFGVDSVGAVFLHWSGSAIPVAKWSPDLAERQVLHLVIDSEQGTASERVDLFVGGNSAVHAAAPTLTQNAEIDLSGGGVGIALGNRVDGSAHAFDGMLYYAAIYNEALTPTEINNNTAVLLDSDDQP